MSTLAFHVGPIAFNQPGWLVLIPVLATITLLIGRRSLSGLGSTSRYLALAARLLVITLVVGAIAQPSFRREARGVNVTVVVDESDSVRKPIKGPDGRMLDVNTFVGQYIDEAASQSQIGDTVARLTVARKAYVQTLPIPPQDKPDSIFTGATDGTNLAAGVSLSLAVNPSNSGNRLLLVSDGNETAGNLLAAASSARAAGVPIDVLPRTYKFDREIMVERIVAPASVRMGQNVNLRVVIRSLTKASGKLELSINGDPVDISLDAADSPVPSPARPASLSRQVSLEPGVNIIAIPVRLSKAGPQTFGAIFTPDDAAADAIEQNNRSTAVTFVQSEGRVLVLAPESAEALPLLGVLRESKLSAEVRMPTDAPTSLVEWGAFDAVILANCSAAGFSQAQQEQMRSYVHDLGGGLVKIGGPESFGAGGWLGSPLADALPVKLDPPQKRQMPRGALALLMHSCEMPNGNYWGQQTALAAINNLSRLDLAGVYEFSFGSGDTRVYPMSEVGNKGAITRAINSLTFGDMPSFDSLLKLCIEDLIVAKAGAKHCIIISDGDPQLLNRSLLTDAKANRVTISTVLVYPHNRARGGPDWDTMERIAKDTGGNFYPIIDQGAFAQLPAIFIKEAQTVKRTLIYEGDPFVPTVVNTVSEPMRGLSGAIPPISGYTVTADRDGLSMVTLRGKENDPILAHWQYGLGKSVAFTSDTAVRWAKGWPSWSKYRAFWEQHVRWAMRPSGSADMRVNTEDQGDRTKLIVEALDAQGERLNFATITGKVVGPAGNVESVELRQVGPGRYETIFDSENSGAYVANLRYQLLGTGQGKEGNLQAAVTRPYADEFRMLEDNAALLKLVADRTGGRVLSPDPRTANLWDRTGIVMPVSLTPIWLTVALVALCVFLFDVGVRRVRIDPALIAGFFRRVSGRSQSRGSQVLGDLKQARQRAQQGSTTSQERKPARSSAADRQAASTKFDATPDELARGRTMDSAASLTDAPGKPRVKVTDKTEPRPDQETNTDEGLSRLKKARQRAQDQHDDTN
jgi:uncharacterized membrane protein